MFTAKKGFLTRFYEGESALDKNPVLAISKAEVAAGYIDDDGIRKMWLEKKKRIDDVVEKGIFEIMQATKDDNPLDRYAKREDRRMELMNWEAREKIDTLRRIGLKEGLIPLE